MSVVVRPLRPFDDAEIRELQEVYERTERARRPDAKVFPIEDSIAIFRGETPGRFYRSFVAVDGARQVGQALVHGTTSDNTDKAFVQVWVPPECTGRGVGRLLADTAEEYAAGLGRVLAITEVGLDGTGWERHRRFAEARGYRLGNVEVERRLDLPMAVEMLDLLAEQARTRHTGYAVKGFVGAVPPDWADGWCAVHNRLPLDAPSGDVPMEQGRRTPEILAGQDASIREMGRTRVSAVALAPDGGVAGFATCVVPAVGDIADHWSTIVAAEHRGHRLGVAVKVACYRLVQQAFPHIRTVTTTNAGGNAPMIAVNDALGFRVHATAGVFQRPLTRSRKS